MIKPPDWHDYELLDSGAGYKLERWGRYTLVRPEPQALWPQTLPESIWREADGTYVRKTITTGGTWTYKQTLPDQWEIGWRDLRFLIRPTPFKHTGLFPEQATNWDHLATTIAGKNVQQKLKILNLFGYTGAATVACARAGAEVTHVDAAGGIVEWAKENAELNKVSARFIVDDVAPFVAREKRRGNRYDGIIMDPPSFGHGVKGRAWKIEKHLWGLVQSCVELLSERPRFFLINSYTTGLSPTIMKNVLEIAMRNFGGAVECDELGLQSSTGILLPAGTIARWNAYPQER